MPETYIMEGCMVLMTDSSTGGYEEVFLMGGDGWTEGQHRENCQESAGFAPNNLVFVITELLKLLIKKL